MSRRIANLSTFIADGRRVAVCAHLQPATEAEVSAEIEAELVARWCVKLSDFVKPSAIVTGALVSISTASRRSIARTGIDTGMPDLWLTRVGCWGWSGIEIKARGKEGRCSGKLSLAQDVAQLSRLTEIVWCAEHVRELIARLDREHEK